MPFRMSRILRFWVEVECEGQDLHKTDDREVAAILREFEGCGDAMRSLNRRGQVVWKATKEMREKLADAEKRLMPKTECENEKQAASCRFNLIRD